MWFSWRWARESGNGSELRELEVDVTAPLPLVLAKLFGSIALVVIASNVLIHSVVIVAERIAVPQSIIAATLVAFGTSLPELVTGITAARHGHGTFKRLISLAFSFARRR